MQNEVIFDAEKQLLRVQFSTDSVVEDWKSAMIQIERLSEKTGVRRVLVDIRKQTELASIADLFYFGSQLPRQIAFAVLCDIHKKEYHFIETVARNRSITGKNFEIEQDAIKWLENWPNITIDSEKK
jgi:hypothetical protein